MEITTPIRDFVEEYNRRASLRLHMPGHKGASLLGYERDDITEIGGADSLYEADGIIRESEENAGRLFGCPTFYSTEGSSLCIRAMLYLALLAAKAQGRMNADGRVAVLAGRNAHKTFISAVALLDMDVMWLYPAEGESYLSCKLTAADVEQALSKAETDGDGIPAAVYLTSPDYLGHTLPVDEIAAVCHRHGVLLLVDNAHGAYLKFLPASRHPVDLGADLCCDSAHKTLPVLTGGAYLHISADAPAVCLSQAKQAMALFGSTSPSYLILQSLDVVNRYLSDGYREKLAAFVATTDTLRAKLTAQGFNLIGDEPLKLTMLTKPYGYRGTDMAAALERVGIVCEFADPDHLVFMLTPEVGKAGLARLEAALVALPRHAPILDVPPSPVQAKAVMSVREATLSACETIPAAESEGRILAAATVGCPPAVPIVVCGERIDRRALACFAYYGINACTVVRK